MFEEASALVFDEQAVLEVFEGCARWCKRVQILIDQRLVFSEAINLQSERKV